MSLCDCGQVNLSKCLELAQQVVSLKADRDKWKALAERTIGLMVSAAGHPDAKIGCRHVVEIGRGALNGLEVKP